MVSGIKKASNVIKISKSRVNKRWQAMSQKLVNSGSFFCDGTETGKVVVVSIRHTFV